MTERETKQSLLMQLLQHDVDAAEAYGVALQHERRESIRARLLEFRMDHLRHIKELSAALERRGEEVGALEPDRKGALLERVTAIAGKLGSEVMLATLIVAEGNPEHLYEEVLTHPWDPVEQKMMDAHRFDERRHQVWLRRSLRERPWAHDTAQR